MKVNDYFLGVVDGYGPGSIFFQSSPSQFAQARASRGAEMAECGMAGRSIYNVRTEGGCKIPNILQTNTTESADDDGRES